ncbi:HK97 family phage prohead protease [Maricaulis sp.]|uniref:HK97 family phage prohead protease n=1 Tax=Maricaulis sp. TaxID=1486257 RepID=UPI0026292324|nr:HK97 family phage prohead protease [Maricaulis sp.]
MSGLIIEGYASLFGLADLSGDVVLTGAFAQSLRQGRSVPMLFQHDPGEPIGVWRALVEDAKGLRVRGEILGETARGRSAQALVKRGAVDGLSIGFRTRRSRPRRPRGRYLAAIDLFEISVVTFPLLPQARLQLTPQPALAA